MKRVISAVVLLVTFYLVIADGMINHFGLEVAHQYAFNYAAILIIMPFSLFSALGMEYNKEDRI